MLTSQVFLRFVNLDEPLSYMTEKLRKALVV